MGVLRRNVIANYLGQGWRAIMSLAFIPLYIEFLGIESYGLIGLFGVMSAWLALLDMGISPTLNREMARYTAGAHTPQSINDLLRSLELISIGMAIFIGILVWFSSDYLAIYWLKAEKIPVPVVAQAISCMAIVAASRFVEGIYRGSLYGLQQQVWYNGASAIIETIRYCGVLAVLSYISNTIEAFFLWQALISLLVNIAFAWRVHRILPTPPSPPRFSRKELLEVWTFAGGMLGISVLSMLLTQVDKVILSKLLTLKSFGYYTLAVTVVGALYLVSAPVMMAVYPRFVELFTKDDNEGLAQLYHMSTQLLTVILAPPTLLIALFGGGIVFMWSGDPTLAHKTHPILSVLVLGTFLHCTMTLPYQCQIAHGWTSLSIKMNIATVSVLVPSLFWIVPQYHALGAVWVWFTLNAFYVVIGIQLMHRKILPKEKWRWYLHDLLIPTLGPVAIAGIAYHLQPSGYQSRLHWFYFLLCVGCLSMFVSSLSSSYVRDYIAKRLKSKIANKQSQA